MKKDIALFSAWCAIVCVAAGVTGILNAEQLIGLWIGLVFGYLAKALEEQKKGEAKAPPF